MQAIADVIERIFTNGFTISIKMNSPSMVETSVQRDEPAPEPEPELFVNPEPEPEPQGLDKAEVEPVIEPAEEITPAELIIEKAGCEVEPYETIETAPTIIPATNAEEEEEEEQKDTDEELEDIRINRSSTAVRYTKVENSPIGYRLNRDSVTFGGAGHTPIIIKYVDIDLIKALDTEGMLTYAQERLDVRQRITFHKAIRLIESGSVKIPKTITSSVIFNFGELEERVNENGYSLVSGEKSLYYTENGGIIYLHDNDE